MGFAQVASRAFNIACEEVNVGREPKSRFGSRARDHRKGPTLLGGKVKEQLSPVL